MATTAKKKATPLDKFNKLPNLSYKVNFFSEYLSKIYDDKHMLSMFNAISTEISDLEDRVGKLEADNRDTIDNAISRDTIDNAISNLKSVISELEDI